MNFEILSILTFFGILATLVIIDRKNIEFGLILMRRTKKGKKEIKEFAKKHKKFFNIFANVGLVIAILLSILGFFYLFKGTGVKLILPKVFPGEASESVQKFVFFMPLWYWVIGLFIILVPHELSHGFLFALEKIKIKSVGLFLLLIFPGGFVEPDEKQFQKSSPKKRMRIAAVGSIANVCVFILLIILSVLITKCFYEENGVYVFQINNTDYPAKQVNLTGIITEIDGNRIRNIQDFEIVLNQVNPGNNIQIKTYEKTYNITLIEHPDRPGKGFIGVSIASPNFLTRITRINPNVFYEVKESYTKNQKSVIVWFSGLIDWVSLISIGVAVANLLPFLPFDGGIMWQAIFEKVTKKKEFSKRMIKILSTITYTLLILNLIGFENVLGILGLI